MEIFDALIVFGLGLTIGLLVGAAAYFALRLLRRRSASRNSARWVDYLEIVDGRARREAQALVADLAKVNRLPTMPRGKFSELLTHRKG